FSPGRAKRLPGVAQPSDFAAVERQADRRGALVAGDDLNRQAEGRLDHLCGIVSAVAGRDGAAFDRRLRGPPLLDAGDAGRPGDAKDVIVVRGHAEVFEFLRVEFDAGASQKLLQKLAADKMAD